MGELTIPEILEQWRNMSTSLVGKTALVTGGSRGIGKAACVALAAAGARVVVHYKTNVRLADQTVVEIERAGGTAVTAQADLAVPADALRLIEAAVAAFGTVDILVNNAGEMNGALVENMPDQVWERCISVNLSQAFRLARACIPLMKRSRWGRIVSVSSQAAFTGSAQHGHYAAAKAGLLGLTYSLAKELAQDGITANVVAPGRIETDMIASDLAARRDDWLRQVPMRRFGRPDEVCGAIVFLASPAASYITGAVLHVNGGMIMG
jgi:NAD(P)-dependent dehydrogenase (short-subunit alcohol dehydrogenase family)